MPRTTRNSRAKAEGEDLDGLMNHCNACGDYHDGIVGPECPIYLADQAKKKGKKNTQVKKPNGSDPKNTDMDLGSTKVVSLLENIALGMDHLLKQKMSAGEGTQAKTQDSARRRSKSVPQRPGEHKKGDPKIHEVEYEEHEALYHLLY